MARPRTTHDEKVAEVESDLAEEKREIDAEVAEIQAIEEHGAEAILNDVEAPDKPEQQEAEQVTSEEHGAEARYWEGDYTGGVPPEGLPGPPPPEITAITPTTITLGPLTDEILTIDGTGFGPSSTASVGVTTFVSVTQLTTLIVAGTQPDPVVLAVTVDGSNSIDVTVA